MSNTGDSVQLTSRTCSKPLTLPEYNRVERDLVVMYDLIVEDQSDAEQLYY